MKTQFGLVIALLMTFFSLQSFPAAAAPIADLPMNLLLERVAADYSKIKTIPELVHFFASNRPAAEQADLIKKFSVLKRLPRLNRTADGFSLEVDGTEEPLQIRAPSLQTRNFQFNGKSFDVDPHQSLILQTDLLSKKLENNKAHGKYSSWFQILVPSAQAQAVGLIIKVAEYAKIGIGLAIANKMVDRYGNWVLDMAEKGVCFVTVDRGQYDATPAAIPKNPNWCNDYWQKKKNLIKENAELAKKSPETEAFKVALNAAQPSGWKYGTIVERCPVQSKEGAYSPYTGFMRIIYDPKDDKSSTKKTEPQEYWVNVSAEFDGKKLKEVKVYKPGDANPEATYQADAESVLTEIVIPAPEGYKEKQFMSDSSHLSIPATGEIKDLRLKSERTLHKTIFAFVASNVTACFKKANEQETAATPALPAAVRRTPATGTH